MRLAALLDPGPEPTYHNTYHPTQRWPLLGRWARMEAIRRYVKEHPSDPVVKKAKALVRGVPK